MSLISNKFKLIWLFIFLTILSGNIFPSKTLLGYENKRDEYITKEKTPSESTYSIPYILDSGDALYVYFTGINIFSGTYNIDPDGNLYLPEIENVYVRGKSIKELEDIINLKYVDYINNPDISINLLSPRPLKVLIKGEVKRPGLYTLSYNSTVIDNSNVQIGSARLFAPKVFDALQMSRGLKLNADLSKVIVIRENSKSNGGGKIKTKLDFLSLLNEGNQKQNIDLRDGDTIIVSKSDKPISKQVLATYGTNINPDSMKIYINGNVLSPGAKAIPINSSLNEAIAISGGRGFSSGAVEFIRFDDYGNLTKKNLKYNLKSPKGSKNNPILMDGDMIMVRKNILGSTTTLITEVGQPIFSGYGLYKLIF